ncbi:MAG: hypothetical protein ACLRVT_02340, partial [Oscillospiraceae bacterium]
MVPAIKENSYPSRFQDYPRPFPKITSVSCRGLFLKPLEKDFYQTYQITVAKPTASRDLQPPGTRWGLSVDEDRFSWAVAILQVHQLSQS